MSENNPNNENQESSERGYGGNFGPGRFGTPGGGRRFGDGTIPAAWYHERPMMGYGGHRPIFPAGMEPPPGMLTGRRGGRRGRLSRRDFSMSGQGGRFPGLMGGGGGFPGQMGGGLPGQGGGMQGMGGFGMPGQSGGFPGGMGSGGNFPNQMGGAMPGMGGGLQGMGGR
ncbi:hypothetical protein LTR15_011821 [Elasticomyces elasticus]|nr:hypothetical protein LTR15_011821 [Elasticomyces elasticus]